MISESQKDGSLRAFRYRPSAEAEIWSAGPKYDFGRRKGQPCTSVEDGVKAYLAKATGRL